MRSLTEFKNLHGLSDRQYEIFMHLITTGQNNRQIGEHFQIAEKTVKFHLTDIFRKTKSKSRLELMVRWNAFHLSQIIPPTDPPTS